MATRKPLVRVGGKIVQLPAEDSIPGAGGGTFTEDDTAPGSPSIGDRWLDTTSGVEYTWISPGIWVDLATTGIDFDDLVQTTGDQSIAGAKTFTGQLGLPTWTTAGRPGSPTSTSIGRNTDVGCIEWWNGSRWVQEGWQSDSLSLSGTGVEFTGIGPTAHEILVVIQDGATAQSIAIQVGPTAGVETSGYVGTTARMLTAGNTVTASTTDFRFGSSSGNATGIVHMNSMPLGNLWVCSGSISRQGQGVSVTGGYISLSGPLTRVAISPGSGSWGGGEAWVFWRNA